MFDPVQALADFVRYPSISTDSTYQAAMGGARRHLAGLLREIGLTVEEIAAPKHPFLLATRRTDPSHPHVVIYGHYDVQPADPLELWASPPFEPEVRAGRMYGRGTADNKGPLLAHVTAAGRLLEQHPDLPLNLTFLFEGEEEIGSPSFPGFLAEHGHRLKGDFIMLSDTGIPDRDQMVITAGLRGIVTFDFIVENARSDLHSGIHGGVLLNPIQALAEVLATLHHPDGRLNVPGYEDDVVVAPAWEREELAALGKSADEYRDWLGIQDFHTIPGLSPFEATRFAPTIEINGIGGGYQGEGSKTVIPAKAFAKLSLRLVANQDPDTALKQVTDTLLSRLSPKVRGRVEIGHSGPPYLVVPPDRPNTPADQNPRLAEAFRTAHAAVTAHFGKPPLYLREGGSVPIIGLLRNATGMDSLMLGLFTADSNLHAPNESVDLGLLERGAAVSEAVLRRVAGIP